MADRRANLRARLRARLAKAIRICSGFMRNSGPTGLMSLDLELSCILEHLILPEAHRSVLQERFADSIDLVKNGEAGVGLENLCDNLFDFEVQLDPHIRDRLAGFCRRHGVDARRVARLESLSGSTDPSGDG